MAAIATVANRPLKIGLMVVFLLLKGVLLTEE
jgi:hypothetical protein